MPTATHLINDADLLRMPRDGRKYEWVDGGIRVSPAGFRHGAVSVALTLKLGAFVLERKLGRVLDSSTGYRMPAGNVRSPDVSFVSAARVPAGDLPTGFAEFRPDLAVEILSPGDGQREVLDKVGEYLVAGVRLVWVIDPDEACAVVFRSLTDVRRVERDGVLEGEDVVPGFACPLGGLLA
jgi:Uma2 family endonuclease